MPVFKNEDNGTLYVMARYANWKGEIKQKCKRGFVTKKEAQEWERMFYLQTSADLDMSFEAFVELYTKDIKNRLKENTWLTKEHIIRTKILPYFGKHTYVGSEKGGNRVVERAAGTFAGRDCRACYERYIFLGRFGDRTHFIADDRNSAEYYHKKLNILSGRLYAEYRIRYKKEHSHEGRKIRLWRDAAKTV